MREGVYDHARSWMDGTYLIEVTIVASHHAISDVLADSRASFEPKAGVLASLIVVVADVEVMVPSL